MNVLGLMSGTSADGVDAVLAHFGGNPAHPRWRFDNLVSIAYPSNLKQAIINLGQSCKFSSKVKL